MKKNVKVVLAFTAQEWKLIDSRTKHNIRRVHELAHQACKSK